MMDKLLQKLNPTPQEIICGSNELVLGKEVNLVIENDVDQDAIRVLKEVLNKNSISTSNESNDNLVTIKLTKVDSCNKINAQGYILNVNDKEIAITSSDDLGMFYGVQTLRQLLVNSEDKVLVNGVTINDHPSMAVRGIVEGFYGEPWSHEQRLEHLKFYGENKLNIYIYAPKSDLYHREKWREPYPENEMDRMNDLIRVARENKVDFVFAISPGIDIKFEGEQGEKDYNDLLNKCEALYEMGVRSFAIYWDDIEDKSGAKQATVLNKFNDDFVKAKGDVKPLITVPTEYCNHGMVKNGEVVQYIKEFSETLQKDIEVMWTGIEVVPEGITLEEAREVREIFGKKLAIWWNYPVSDYYQNKLALGPICKLDKRLDEEVQIFTMNPMRFAETSKVALFTGADYGWNVNAYDYDKSWDNAMNELYGILADDFKYFANHSTRMDAGWAVCGRDDAPEMRAYINNMLNKIDDSQSIIEEYEALNKEFEKVQVVGEKLSKELPQYLLSECEKHVKRFALIGKTSKVALDLLVSLNNKDENTKELNKQLTSLIEEIKVGPKLSEKVMINFIKEVFERANKTIEDNAKINYKVISSPEANSQEDTAENIFNQEENAFISKDNVEEGQVIEIDLGDVVKVNNIELMQVENTVKGKLQFSTNRANWLDIVTENNEGSLIINVDSQIQYIRYTALENCEFQWNIKKFTVNN